MRDLETIVIENDAIYQGSLAFQRGEERVAPYPPYKERLTRLWLDAYDKAKATAEGVGN